MFETASWPGGTGCDESEILGIMRNESEAEGLDADEIIEAHDIFGSSMAPLPVLSKDQAPAAVEGAVASGTTEAVGNSVDEWQGVRTKTFWVSVNPKSGFRRLPKSGACTSSRGRCTLREEQDSMGAECADAICWHC